LLRFTLNQKESQNCLLFRLIVRINLQFWKLSCWMLISLQKHLSRAISNVLSRVHFNSVEKRRYMPLWRKWVTDCCLTPIAHFPVFSGIFSLMCLFCRSLFVIFLLAIVLSVLLGFTDSIYPFGIFKLFSPSYIMARASYISTMRSPMVSAKCINRHT